MPTFEKTELESMIRSGIRELMDGYDDEYWLRVSEEEGLPDVFWTEMADHDWIGLTVPEEDGGQGLGMQEVVMVIEEVVLNGGWPAALSFLQTSLFGCELLSRFGTQTQKDQWLQPMMDGEAHFALGLTEPNVGLDTTNLETTAETVDDGYIINGEKTWTTMAGTADRMVVLVRTTPKSECERSSQGLSMLLVDPEQNGVEYDEIPISLWHHDPSYSVYYDDVHVDKSALIGEKDRGLQNLFEILNTERIAGACAANALGRYAIQQASQYAKDRVVFGNPIGSYQGIQHPLADGWADLACTRLMVQKAAWAYDQDHGKDEVGKLSNTANLKACEAAFTACEAAMTTYGGMSASKEVAIAQIWQDVRHMRTAPVSEQMLRNYLAENELGLPRSY
ncbi:acyl-CoA dehydrogenase family protein [Halobacteriales archaeon Cl-PHB]